MDPSALDRAHAEVGRRLESVSADHWDLPTPCQGWAVMDLVRHMAVGATMSRQILAGGPWTRDAVVEEVSSAPDLKTEWDPSDDDDSDSDSNAEDSREGWIRPLINQQAIRAPKVEEKKGRFKGGDEIVTVRRSTRTR